MPATILSLFAIHFDTRIALEHCMVNVDGETLDCIIDKLPGSHTRPTYVVFQRMDDGSKGVELFTFNPYHLSSMSENMRSSMYSISGAGKFGSSATLIIPYPEWLYKPSDIEDECQDEEAYLDSSCYPVC